MVFVFVFVFGTLETSLLVLKINKSDIKYFRLIDKMKRMISGGSFGKLFTEPVSLSNSLLPFE